MADRIRVRSPFVEGLAVMGQGLLASPGRSLTVSEQSLLQTVFDSSINYDLIRIAQTEIGPSGRPYTLANTIRVPPKTDFTSRVLVHEATHVWQYQTKGSGYISDSLWHQGTQGDRAYVVTLAAGQSIHGYTAEQQAVIVEAYYVDRCRKPTTPATKTDFDPTNPDEDVPIGWSLLKDVVRVMDEIRRARPLPESAILQERLFGPGWNADDKLPPSSGRSNRNEILPLLRIEF